jgi:predicted Zn finger-like uncharacterized protein
MRIVCPSCQAAYEVPDAVLRPAAPGAPARMVKCARCGNAWAPAAEAPAPEPPPAPAPPEAAPQAPPPAEEDLPPPPPVSPATPAGPEPAPRKPEPAPVTRVSVPRAAEKLTPPDPPSESARGPGMVVTILAWVTSLALLGGLGWAVVIWRGAIMAAWAPSRRFYDVLGLM